MTPPSFAWICAAALSLSPGFVTSAAVNPKPNIVFILIDNVGYGDLGCYGNTVVRTPNMDRLASEGVRCTDFYVASPTCSVSRGALLTGRYPERNGLTKQLPSNEKPGDGLNPREILLPHYLKQAGYATGCFGKWNIGFLPGLRPTERGFDEFLGHASGNINYYSYLYNGRNDLYRGTESITTNIYSTDLFAGAACDFIRRHSKGPFFAYVPFNAAHYPNPRNTSPGETNIWQVPEEYLTRYGWSANEQDPRRRYQAVLTALDSGIGRILKEIDDLKLRANTLVILLSDNGAFMLKDRGLEVASNLPFRDGGVTLWEGGIRVPCMVRWPGHFKPGTLCSEPLIQLDLAAMALAAAGLPRPKNPMMDGLDPTVALAGRGPSPHTNLFWEYGPMSALRSGSWKLIRPAPGAPFQLYNLKNDPAESRDVSQGQSTVVAELKELHQRWLAEARGGRLPEK
jgi:arylsulfatase A